MDHRLLVFIVLVLLNGRVSAQDITYDGFMISDPSRVHFPTFIAPHETPTHLYWAQQVGDGSYAMGLEMITWNKANHSIIYCDQLLDPVYNLPSLAGFY